MVNIIIVITGFISGLIIFFKIPKLQSKVSNHSIPKVSVIVPVRNEATNIRKLLTDLQKQSIPIHEIICVNDNSTDQTLRVLNEFEITVIDLKQKPENWNGKTYASQKGALKATGDVLLFLDADVRLDYEAIATLLANSNQGTTVTSVQPYHAVNANYEQTALFFNLVTISACGLNQEKIGLFGPVILIPRSIFFKVNGYESIKTSIVEDVELGKVLKQHHINFKLFTGGDYFSFKMYDNFSDLYTGYTKNMASGATKAPFWITILIIFWFMALTVVPLLLITSILQTNLAEIIIYAICCLLFVLQLLIIVPKIGSFKRIYICLYPLSLLIFHTIFFHSLYSLLFKKKVKWKGREINLQ